MKPQVLQQVKGDSATLGNVPAHFSYNQILGSRGLQFVRFPRRFRAHVVLDRKLTHLPLLSGYDEPRALSYQITLFGPISADVRHP
jgi:hypothetical protein